MKFARICDITKEGTNEGFVHYDSDFITKYESDTAKVLREDLRDDVYDLQEYYPNEYFESMSDKEIIDWALENTSLYYTDFTEE